MQSSSLAPIVIQSSFVTNNRKIVGILLKAGNEDKGLNIQFEHNEKESLYHVRDVSSEQEIIEISATSGKRNIYDKKTNSMREILVQGDINRFTSGETFKTSNVDSFSGFVSGGGKEIYFTVPIPKSGKGMEVVAQGSFLVRGINGYVTSWTNISNYLIDIKTLSDNYISVMVKNKDDSEFGVTNNTPVSVVGDLAFTFS